jgi:hypothetical protein
MAVKRREEKSDEALRAILMKSDQKEKHKKDGFIVRLDPERASQVRRWAMDHMTKVQPMLVRGLELVMGERVPENAQPKKPQKFTSPETDLAYNIHAENEWIIFTDFVLRSPNATIRYGLESNICAFLAMLDDDGVDNEADPIPAKNFSILLARARSTYAKLKLRKSRNRQTKTTATESSGKKGSD